MPRLQQVKLKNTDEKTINKVNQQSVAPPTSTTTTVTSISDPNENIPKSNVTVSVPKQNLNVKAEEFARLENVVVKLPESSTPSVKQESSTSRLTSESSKTEVELSRTPKKRNNYKEDNLEEELGLKLSKKKRAMTFIGENYFSMSELSDSEILPKMATTTSISPISNQNNANNNNINSESNSNSQKVGLARKAHRRALSDIDPRYRKVHKLYEPLQVHMESFEERVLKAMEVVAEYEKNSAVPHVEIIDDDH